MQRKHGSRSGSRLVLGAGLALCCARGATPPSNVAPAPARESPAPSAPLEMAPAETLPAAAAAPETSGVWLREPRGEQDCPLAPSVESAGARLAPALIAQAWQARLAEWSTPGFFATWREQLELRHVAVRRGRVAFLGVEEQPGQATRIWFDARHFELPPALRADSPERAETLLLAFSHCFSEYPPGEPPRAPTPELWVPGDHSRTPVELPLDGPLLAWLKALPSRP